ncbi:ROK family protein [Oscillochloris sp. ZM17-4]|uniref:ROK family protein n=1 Tax=Oscillochloris sp. ZM17-4 TaxID=2866714 RepID=UPI001C731A91|nr:ROK family protein [Oscillochloris sp. ZM17-4]
MKYVIGADIGGTQLRAALIAADGTIIAHERARTFVEQGPDAVITRVLDLIAQVRTGLPPGGDLLGIGVGAPGPLNPETGMVYAPPNMPGWYHIQLRDALALPTGLPVVIDNDANVAALGEWRFGAGAGTRHMVYLTVSTGIGGGVIVDGKLLLGRMGAAAELGSIFLDAERGLRWEELASGSGLGEAAAAAMPAHPASMLHTLASPQTVTAAHVARAAAAGDDLARSLMEREAHLLGLGFASILHIFSPELLLVGGSVALENPDLLARARAIAYERVLVDLYRDVPILPASLGERAGVLGAAALMLAAAEGH